MDELNREYCRAKNPTNHTTRYKLIHNLIKPIRTSGIVIKGQGLQSLFGYPTANIKNNDNIERGLYLGRSEFGSMLVMVTSEKIEAHIIDWHGDLYGRELSMELFSKFDGGGLKQFVDTI